MLDTLTVATSANSTPDAFFSWASLGTLSGATGATIVLGNAARRLLRRDVLWIPFIAALVVCLATARVSGNLSNVSDLGLALLNGVLVFTTALGANEAGSAAVTPAPARPVRLEGRAPVGWSWLRRP